MSEYQKQAQEFLDKTATSFRARYHHHGFHFPGDKQERDIYTILLKNEKGTMSFKFGQAIAYQGQVPTVYDVLTCLTKSDPGSFEDFCSECGYDNDSIKAKNIYKAVVKEWKKLSSIFTEDELLLLQEIN